MKPLNNLKKTLLVLIWLIPFYLRDGSIVNYFFVKFQSYKVTTFIDK